MNFRPRLGAIWLLAVPGIAAGAPPAAVPDWASTRNGPSFSGYAATTLPSRLRFAWAARAAPGGPVTLGGRVYTSHTEPPPLGSLMGLGTLSARSMAGGAKAWSQDPTILGLFTTQPAAGLAGKTPAVFVAALDENLGKIVAQAYDAATGARLWTSAFDGVADLMFNPGNEVSLPFPGTVAYSGLTDNKTPYGLDKTLHDPSIWSVFVCGFWSGIFVPALGECVFLDSASGLAQGKFDAAPVDNTRPVVAGSLVHNVDDRDPDTHPGFWEDWIGCHCVPGPDVYVRSFDLSKGALTTVSTAIAADEQFGDCSLLCGILSCSPTGFALGPGLGEIGLASAGHLLGIAGGGLTARDPGKADGGLGWLSPPLMTWSTTPTFAPLDRNRVATGNGKIVAVSARGHHIFVLSESTGALLTSTPFDASVAVSSAVTLTNDAILFGDAAGLVHVFDLGTLAERQRLKVADAAIVGELAIVGQEVFASAADGTLVKVSGTGFECDATSPGYAQNGHQLTGPGGINTLSGNFAFSVQDFSIPFAGLSVSLLRTYNSERAQSVTSFSADGTVGGAGGAVGGTPFFSSLGPGWTHSYQVALRPQFDKASGSSLYVEDRGDGREVGYTVSMNGTVLPPPGIVEDFSFTVTGSALAPTTTVTGVALRSKRGRVRLFDRAGNLLTIRDANANHLDFTYTPAGAFKAGATGVRLTRITYFSSTATGVSSSAPPVVRSVDLGYDANAQLSTVDYPDPSGSGTLRIGYQYNLGLLTDVLGPNNGQFYHAHYDYDTSNRMTFKQEPREADGAKRLRYVYDPQGRVSTVTTASGRVVATYSYVQATDNGLLTFITQFRPGGPQIAQHRYDRCSFIEEVVDPLGGRTRYDWDVPNLRQLRQVDADGHSTSWFYDSKGNVLAIVDALGGSRFSEYEPVFNQKTKDVDANGGETRFVYDGTGNMTATDQVLKPIPALGEPGATFRTAYVIDNRGLRVSATEANGSQTYFSYDGPGNLTATARRLLQPPSSFTDLTTKYEYDALGRRTAQVDPNGVRTEFDYDVENRLIQTRAGIVSGGPPLSTLTYTYDTLNRLMQKTDAVGRFTAYTYDEQDRVQTVSDALGHTTTHVYDDVGNRLQTEDPNHHVTRFASDALGRLVTVTDPEGGTARYGYDPVGNLTTVTDPNGHVTRYSYDPLNRLSSVQYTDGTTDQFTYDAVGNRLTKTDGRNVTATNVYDSLNRLRRVTYSDGTPALAYRYDQVGDRVRAETTVDGDPYVVTDAFDSLKRLTQENTGVAGTPFATKQFGFDAVGNRLSLTVDAAQTTGLDHAVSYAYDALNRVASVTNRGQRTTYAYEPGCASCGGGGNLTDIDRPNWTHTHMEYDLSGRLTKLRNSRSRTGAAMSFFTYTYDNMSNRVSMKDLIGTHQYSYDKLYRLTGVADPGGSTQAYQYDPAGNRLTLTPTGGFTQQYTYNDLNELVSVQAGPVTSNYTFDGAGNLTSKTGTGPGGPLEAVTYAFDGTNRLTSVTSSSPTVTYGYDADGKRVKQVANGQTTWFVFDGLSAVMELGADKKPTAVLVPGISKTRLDLHEPLTEFYLHDGLGSVVQLTDVLGNLTQEYLYDPFGATKNVRRDPFNRYRFVSLAQDDLTGLTYMNARWYDAAVGRFGSRDRSSPSFAPTAGTQGLSLYVYVENNPLAYSDVTGQFKRKNREECVEQANDLMRAREELARRRRENEANPDPGHDKAIKQLENRVRKLQEKYDNDCGERGPPPAAAPTGVPEIPPQAMESPRTAPSGNTGAAAGLVALELLLFLLLLPAGL